MYAEAADTTLHYDLRGSGPRLVVLTHGLGSDLEYWAPHVDALAAHHRVLRWDLRGAGRSAKLCRVRAPTLILQGLDDALTPPGGSVILSRGIPRSRLVMVPGAGHNLPIEMPALFTTAVLAFLAGLDL